MKILRYGLMGVIAASLLGVAGVSSAGDPALKVDYPEGWRDWTHIKSMVIFDKVHPLFDAFGGIHHVYGNDAAVKHTRILSDPVADLTSAAAQQLTDAAAAAFAPDMVQSQRAV